MNRILMIDDDIDFCELIGEYLALEGFAVEPVHDGEEGVRRALSNEHELILLDVMLTGISGFEVLRRIRAGSAMPVLMLTARGEEVDRIVGLEMGADDYLPKPFNPRELVARVRAIKRRTGTPRGDGAPPVRPLTVGDLELDSAARAVLLGGVPVNVSSVEFSILEVLLRLAGQVVSRDELALQALGRQLNTYDRSIDVHVSSLRKKLGPNQTMNDRIKTVRGVGYIYARPVAGR
jgi:DNA-binding response OmpR family regulator